MQSNNIVDIRDDRFYQGQNFGQYGQPHMMQRSASNTIENKENKNARNNQGQQNFVKKGGNYLVQHSPVKQSFPVQKNAVHAAQTQPQRMNRTALPRGKRPVTPTIKPNYLKNVQSKIRHQI
jgi:hypothetical protein